MAGSTTRLLGWALVVVGAILFLTQLELLENGVGPVALAVLAGLALLHLARTVDPAWILTAGLLSTMFAGNWDHLDLSADIAPHRVLIAAGLLAVLLRAPPARDRPALHLDRRHFALAAALGYVVVSAAFSGTLENRQGQFAFIDQYGLVPFALFLAAPLSFASRRQRGILLGGLVVAGTYLSITAVLEELELYDLVFPRYIGDPAVGNHFGRSRGPFAEAAANGLALYACAAAAAVAFVRWRRPLHRLGAGLVLLLAPVGLLLTVTRAAWLSGIAGTIVAFTTTERLRRYLVPVAVAGTIGVIGSFALIPGLAKEAGDRADDKAPVYERQNTNAAGLRMLADRPVFGFGWWFEEAEMEPYFRLHPDIPLTGAAAGLHNIYLSYGVALGMVGLALWLLAMALVFGPALSARVPPELAAWQIGLRAAFPAWLVIGVFGPANYSFTTALVWTWAGLLGARSGQAHSAPQSSARGFIARDRTGFKTA